jgi:exosortase
LLYRRRKLIPEAGFQTHWWGLLITAVGVALRILSFTYYLPWLDASSLLVCLAGLAATMGGRAGLRWAWLSILFLGFMIPLPYRFHNALGGQLQSVATALSTYLLQTFGVPAVSDGNMIFISHPPPLKVEEACSGLGMLVTFFALALGYAIFIGRHWGYGVLLVLAAVPIALSANVIRITSQGILCELTQNEWARKEYHTWAGLLMMPLGVALLAVVLFVLDRATRYQHPRA